MYNSNKGYEYEQIAKKYLLNRGYEIVEQNFSSKFGEIDIIVSKDGVLSFVEVKGRKNSDFGMPREWVTPAKQRKIIKTAQYFMLINKLEDIQCKFDVIEIINNTKTINYIENAFW